jgi:4-hydroxy-tetrahydrodipicolinate reductase
MTEVLPIAVHGATGRMGRRVLALAAEDPSLRVVAAIGRPGGARLGADAGEVAGIGRPIGVAISADLPAGAAPSAAIDFSAPEATGRFLEVCRARAIPLVVATTGLSDSLRAEIERASASIPILVAANLSLGVALARRLVAEVARSLGPEADIEIVESHHRGKKDAPSGTALALARAAAEARGQDSARDLVFGRGPGSGPRRFGEIGVHALRLGDVVGEHVVSFAFGAERIEIGHKAHSRDVFAAGALRAARFVATAKPGLYGPEAMLSI